MKLKRRESKGGNIKPRSGGSEPQADESKPPIFSFEYLQPDWCVENCQQVERSKMLSRLRRLGQMSWKDIRQQDKHGYGTETIPRHILKAPIPSFVTEDVRLIAFRAYDLVSMVGYKQDRVFHVIWIDREFKLYRH